MQKKILSLLVILAAVSFGASAQTSFGLRAGVNFQNINGKIENGDKTDNKLKTGFHVGVNADVPVATDYFVQPGLLFSTKGAKYANNNSTSISYIEIPVNFLYKPILADGRLLLGFGPYAAFAINGKYKTTTTKTDIVFDNTRSATSPVTFKRFDAGANFLAGYELSNKLSFQLNAQLGLMNINPENKSLTNDKTALKNTGFGISLGYKL